MNILANVTSSLIGDYNEMLEYFAETNVGGAYFNFTLADSENIANINLDNYDLIINFFDDEDDNMDVYSMLLNYAKSHNMINNFVSYYKSKPFYTSERVYYAKKRAKHDRIHRLFEYDEIDEVVFDFLVQIHVYNNADISIENGMLKLMDYEILDLGGVRMLANNVIINDFYKKIISAGEEEQSRIVKSSPDDFDSLIEIEKVQGYMRAQYSDFDRYLEYATMLYAEIIKAFALDTLSTLEYTYLKDYFDIGHFTSIASCFYQIDYEGNAEMSEEKFKSNIAILKMIAYSLAFADKNEFVTDVLNNIFDIGRKQELEMGRDEFFHYNMYEYMRQIDKVADISYIDKYLDLVRSNVLIPNEKNLLKALEIRSQEYYKEGNIDKSIEIHTEALAIAKHDIDKVKHIENLFVKYYINGNIEEAEKYSEKIGELVYLLDTGYFNTFAKAMITFLDNSKVVISNNDWKQKAINKAINNKNLDIVSHYLISLKNLFDMDNGITLDTRISSLERIVKEIENNYYVKPTKMVISLYNALIVLGKLLEDNGDDVSAAEMFNKALGYMTCMEKSNAEIDEDIAFVQYKLGDTAINMDNFKSYQHLAKAEKRIYQYILKSKKYVDFYIELLISINERYIEDGRFVPSILVTRNNLNKLRDCATLCDEYYRDAVAYCRVMADNYSRCGKIRYAGECEIMMSNYIEICKHHNIKIEDN